MRVYVGYRCDVGRVRASNQDTIGIDIDSGFFVVADGMGGHSGGEFASKIVVDSIKESVTSSPPNYQEKINALITGIQEANTKIFQLSSTDIEKRGMGTTVTALLVGWGKYFIAHIGDSRAYLIRDGEIIPITRDHSFVQGLVNSGIITPEEARNHERRNEITRAVGIAPEVEIDTYEGEFKETDAILLCSDGLWGELSDEEILNTVLNGSDPQDACNRLVDSANDKGGSDNISVILAQSFPTISKALPLKKKLKLKRPIYYRLIKRTVIGIGAVVLTIFLILIFFWLIHPFQPGKIWVKFKTKPETLYVTLKKSGKPIRIINNDPLPIAIGETLVCRKSGFYDSILVIEPGKKEYAIGLKPKLVPVNFPGLPPQTRVSIMDDRGGFVKVTTEKTVSLPFGSYRLHFKHPQYQYLDTLLEIAYQAPIDFGVKLKPLPPEIASSKKIPPENIAIRITGFAEDGTPDLRICGSEVFIDGIRKDKKVPSTKSPVSFIKLTLGEHIIELRKNGEVIGRATVTLSEGNYDATLRPKDFKIK